MFFIIIVVFNPLLAIRRLPVDSGLDMFMLKLQSVITNARGKKDWSGRFEFNGRIIVKGEQTRRHRHTVVIKRTKRFVILRQALITDLVLMFIAGVACADSVNEHVIFLLLVRDTRYCGYPQERYDEVGHSSCRRMLSFSWSNYVAYKPVYKPVSYTHLFLRLVYIADH